MTNDKLAELMKADPAVHAAVRKAQDVWLLKTANIIVADEPDY